MRENGGVTAPEFATPHPWSGVLSVWVVAVVAAVSIGLFVPPAWRAQWLVVALGGSLLLSFVVQLVGGRSQGFIRRVALSTLGSLLAMGLISVGFGLAAVVPG